MIGRLRRRAAWVLDRRIGILRRRMDELGGQLLGIAALSGEATASVRAVGGEVGEVRRELADVRTELRRLAELRGEVAALREEVAVLHARVDERFAGVDDAVGSLREHVSPVLRAIVTEEAANLRRLEQLRTTPEYLIPFDHPDPLVTVCIPTHDRVDTLTGRSLPSVLAQTHRRLEVLVIGDASPPHVERAVEGFDERVRFVNLTQRHGGTGADRHWLVGSVPPRNAGYALAGGHWIVDFDDDDELRPDAIERTLALARAERLEVAYGKVEAHYADGRTAIVGHFPPAPHQFSWQGAVVHAGLRFLERQLIAAEFGQPNDWFRVISMLRIGVRFGMVDEVLYDYYPARSWQHEATVPESAFMQEPPAW